MASVASDTQPAQLPAYALFAALLAAAGLPIYIHAPKFFVDEYGVSLSALGMVLFWLRSLDVIQDPLLGRLAEALRNHRSLAVATGSAVMAISMFALFAMTPSLPPLVWFGLTLTGVFTSFSFLTICFYAQGVAKAERLPGRGHLALARWRETGALLGVCVASVAPVVLAAIMGKPFTGFAIGFALLALGATVAMQGEWRTTDTNRRSGFGAILKDRVARHLLLIAFLNAAPVAVTSTVFLFYVEATRQSPEWAGPLLLVFFLSAAIAAPLWGYLAEAFGAKPVLLAAMALAIAAFVGAFFLGAGDVALFAVVCIVSGAALGADLTLLPAMFAMRLGRIAPSAAEGFGLWAFVSKLTLAFAAVTLLPILQMSGFVSGELVNTPHAIATLVWLYAGLPCALKGVAMTVLAGTSLHEDDES